MNQPEPSGNLPDYNVAREPRPRRRFKFNPFRAPTDFSGYYSAFWPLLIVFLSFIILLLYEISVLRFREATLVQRTNHYNEMLDKQKWQADLIQGIHNDLKDLAPTDPAAAALLKDFFPDVPSSDSAMSNPASPAPSPTPSP
ncbi:MAG: hypothetical protein LV479_04740 [Methylacidiphilales bacterium]|nr:hypothetical protein [Candidatus Methylacidiphilales bacterium]